MHKMMLLRFLLMCVCVMLLAGCEKRPKVRVYTTPKEESKAAVPVMKPQESEPVPQG